MSSHRTTRHMALVSSLTFGAPTVQSIAAPSTDTGQPATAARTLVGLQQDNGVGAVTHQVATQ